MFALIYCGEFLANELSAVIWINFQENPRECKLSLNVLYVVSKKSYLACFECSSGVIAAFLAF